MQKHCVLCGRMGVILSSIAILGFGCASPSSDGPTIIKDPSIVDSNPLGSAEIQQCAQNIASQMLMAVSTDEKGNTPVRIRIMPLRNQSSVRIDSRIVTDGLKNELAAIAHKNASHDVVFITDNRNALVLSDKILRERMEKQRSMVLEQIADELLASHLVSQNSKPPVIAVTPVINSNLINLNGNAFVSMLRGHIARKANGKILFTAPGTTDGADYYLTGEFIAESMKNEGMVNMVDYITLMEERLKAGKTMDDILTNAPMESEKIDRSNFSEVKTTLTYERYKSLLAELSRAASLRSEPDVNKHLNIMIVKVDNKVSVFENMFLLDMKSNERLSNIDYVLSGNISTIVQRGHGQEVCYLVITFLLIDPETGEEVWNGRYEQKKKVHMNQVYY